MPSLKSYFFIAPIIIYFGVIFFISFNEYWLIAVESDPKIIELYRFGTEAMIAHGGEKYRTPESYSESSLVLTVLSFIGAVSMIVVLHFCRTKRVLKSYAVGVLMALTLFIVG